MRQAGKFCTRKVTHLLAVMDEVTGVLQIVSLSVNPGAILVVNQRQVLGTAACSSLHHHHTAECTENNMGCTPHLRLAHADKSRAVYRICTVEAGRLSAFPLVTGLLKLAQSLCLIHSTYLKHSALGEQCVSDVCWSTAFNCPMQYLGVRLQRAH